MCRDLKPTTEWIESQSDRPRHIDRLVTYFFDVAEVQVHIRTKLKIPARG
jgi:hypothetical protein